MERAVVLGHSWGTLVAVALALNHRPSVRSLVLLSGFYFPRFRFDVLVSSVEAAERRAMEAGFDWLIIDTPRR